MILMIVIGFTLRVTTKQHINDATFVHINWYNVVKCLLWSVLESSCVTHITQHCSSKLCSVLLNYYQEKIINCATCYNSVAFLHKMTWNTFKSKATVLHNSPALMRTHTWFFSQYLGTNTKQRWKSEQTLSPQWLYLREKNRSKQRLQSTCSPVCYLLKFRLVGWGQRSPTLTSLG